MPAGGYHEKVFWALYPWRSRQDVPSKAMNWYSQGPAPPTTFAVHVTRSPAFRPFSERFAVSVRPPEAVTRKVSEARQSSQATLAPTDLTQTWSECQPLFAVPGVQVAWLLVDQSRRTDHVFAPTSYRKNLYSRGPAPPDAYAVHVCVNVGGTVLGAFDNRALNLTGATATLNMPVDIQS